eukprot:TRINITY_DN1007_c0_g1_i4.p1 TRINITY_DN1007_c0_g1~~TRINITY_DN1007_c0_g1_i4.p1  ORF type:complete len:242 (-),score=56.69 TRINITY_DN1007_c0_g1_i4:394-1119(-)
MFRSGFVLYPSRRHPLRENRYMYRCVVGIDSGNYTFEFTTDDGNKIKIPFQLVVTGRDGTKLKMLKPNSDKAITGKPFAQQPELQSDNANSEANFDVLMSKSPASPFHPQLYYLQVQSDVKKKTAQFNGMTITGSQGLYSFDYIDTDTCDVTPGKQVHLEPDDGNVPQTAGLNFGMILLGVRYERRDGISIISCLTSPPSPLSPSISLPSPSSHPLSASSCSCLTSPRNKACSELDGVTCF